MNHGVGELLGLAADYLERIAVEFARVQGGRAVAAILNFGLPATSAMQV
ncbi:MAG: hypothetical protein OSB10_00060 [Planctomycetota bacterium]|nr:hypothetical protein [Planctomycetota bacterium]